MLRNLFFVSTYRTHAILLVALSFFLAGLCFADQAGPKYSNLRYDEDFSYLADTGTSYQDDIWDPIKWIPLSDDWTLSIGGQARLRFESETNKNFGSTEPTQDAFLLQRYFVHFDFINNDDGLRFFLQAKFAHVNDRDRGGEASLEDHADFHQAFLDITTPLCDYPTTFRLGRQELQYGAQRLISPLDWGNLRRTFDGVKVFTETDDWKIDAFAVRPVINDRRNLDDEDENIDFYGLYTTYKGTEALHADYYFLLLKNNNLNQNSNSRTGRRTLYTLGTRLWGKQDAIDYEAEGATQFGTFAGDRVRAWMATVGGGYTFSDQPWQPRLGILYDYASGDADANDDTHTTFNQLFPLGHAWLGYLDKVGRSNIHALKLQLKAKPSKKLTTWIDFHTFLADKEDDSLYSASGAPTNGGSGDSNKIGHELDITAKYKIDVHTTALVGWAHLWPGSFITGTPDDADLFYAQIEYKF